MFPALSVARPATARLDPKLVWLAGSSVAPAPSPVPVSASVALLLSELFTVSGVVRAPGTFGVKLTDDAVQSAVVSALVVHDGVLDDHSVEE